MLACTPCTVNMSDADIHGIVRHRPIVNPLIRLRVFAAACIFLCGFSVTLKAFLCHSARHQLKQRSHRLRLRAAPCRMLRWLFSLQHGARAKSQLGQRKSFACTNLHNCFAEKGRNDGNGDVFQFSRSLAPNSKQYLQCCHTNNLLKTNALAFTSADT